MGTPATAAWNTTRNSATETTPAGSSSRSRGRGPGPAGPCSASAATTSTKVLPALRTSTRPKVCHAVSGSATALMAATPAALVGRGEHRGQEHADHVAGRAQAGRAGQQPPEHQHPDDRVRGVRGAEAERGPRRRTGQHVGHGGGDDDQPGGQRGLPAGAAGQQPPHGDAGGGPREGDLAAVRAGGPAQPEGERPRAGRSRPRARSACACGLVMPFLRPPRCRGRPRPCRSIGRRAVPPEPRVAPAPGPGSDTVAPCCCPTTTCPPPSTPVRSPSTRTTRR